MNEEPEDVDYDKVKADNITEKVLMGSGLLLVILLFLALMWGLCSCTISFQNISTHGTATDLVDEDQKSDAQVDPEVSVPAVGL
jgi:hypothetical protein